MKTKPTILILIITLAGIILHLAFANTMGFHRDELLYFSQSMHPAFGYFSVPPLTAWLALFSAKIFGYTLFAAKVLPAVIGGITIILCSLMAKEMGGGARAQILAAVAMTCSLLFMRAFYMFQPVPFDIFFWTLMLFLLLRFLNTHHSKYLILLGISLGLSLLNKYNPAFLLISFLLIIPFTKERIIFTQKSFFLAVLLAFLIFLPNVIWQLTHGMPVIHHMNELTETQLVHMSLGIFLKEQLLMILPGTIIAIPGLFYLLLHKDLKPYRITGLLCITVLLIFILLKGKSYYTAGIYPLLIAAGATGIMKSFSNRILYTGIILFLLAGIWFLLPMGVPIWSPVRLTDYFDKFAKASGSNDVRRFEDNKYHALPQDYADMLGWDELTRVTLTAWNQVPDKQAAFIFGDNYGEAGAITVIGRKYGLPEAVSFNESFQYWRPIDFPKEIQSVVYINNEEPGEDIYELFGEVNLIGRISNPLAREYGTGVWLCTSPKKSFNEFWKTK